MIRLALTLLRRDLMGMWGAGGAWLPVLFFIGVATVFPFAVGPDPRLLARAGGGIVWVAALLASVMPVERLVAPDLEAGFFDQWALRGVSAELVLLVRLKAHWLSFALPLMLAALPAGAMLGLDGRTLGLVELGLLAGTPGLAALGVLVGSVTAGLRGGAALAGLLLLPLAVPCLIFGAGSLVPGGESGLAFTAAASLLLVAIAPFAGAMAVRAGR